MTATVYHLTNARLVKLQDIVVPEDRLRRVNREAVKDISKSFADVGQISPVVVWRNGAGSLILSAGEHRFEASKLTGWSDILAVEIKFPEWADDEYRSVAARRVEIDENMARKELDYAEATNSRAELVIVQERYDRWLLAKIEEAEAEHREVQRIKLEAAEKAKREEQERAKAAEDKAAADRAAIELRRIEEEKAKIKAAEDRARKTEWQRSDRAVHKPFPTGSDLWTKAESPEQVASRRKGMHGLALAAEKASKQSGEKVGELVKAVGVAQNVGTDNLRILGGTQNATKAEITSLDLLHKHFPEQASRLLARAKSGANVSFRAEYGKLCEERNKEQARSERDNAKSDPAKMARYLAPLLAQAMRNLGDAAIYAKDAGMMDDHRELNRLMAAVSQMHSRMDGYRNISKAKATDGIRPSSAYKGSKPEDTEAREQAKRDQEANSKVSVATLRTK